MRHIEELIPIQSFKEITLSAWSCFITKLFLMFFFIISKINILKKTLFTLEPHDKALLIVGHPV